MFQTKTVLVFLVSSMLFFDLSGAGFCIYENHEEKSVGDHSEMQAQIYFFLKWSPSTIVWTEKAFIYSTKI